MQIVLLLCSLLVACSQPAWHTTDVRGKLPPLAFTLTDTQGRLRHGEQFHGRITLLFTGFTHCPDVCPTTLARLATALQGIPGSQARIQVLFVSLDPERDTPDVLERYVRGFGPWFVGLTGTPQQLKELTQRYFLSFAKNPDADIIHSSRVLIFDRQGNARLLASADVSVEDLSADLQRLLKE